MPQMAANQGVVLTIGFTCFDQRFQCVMGWIGNNALDPVLYQGDVSAQMINVIVPAWRACLAADCEVEGYSVEGMVIGKVIPSRIIYNTGQFPGLEGTESYSPNCSMLLAFYGSDQPDITHRTRVAKNFIGPPPETQCQADIVSGTFVVGQLTPLADILMNAWVGSSTGVQYARALSISRTPGSQVWIADKNRVRHTIFTQRRRVYPNL